MGGVLVHCSVLLQAMSTLFSSHSFSRLMRQSMGLHWLALMLHFTRLPSSSSSPPRTHTYTTHTRTGASGFGTPVALAAPMLASLGHDPLLTVVCLLVMNTFATQFGELVVWLLLARGLF